MYLMVYPEPTRPHIVWIPRALPQIKHLDCEAHNSALPSSNVKKKVVGLERGALSLVSTTEELLDRKVAAPV
jgi:hypothetical protein